MNKVINFFSIIELFVVISVIIVLATFTLPLVSNIYQSANEVVCKNNLKNIGSLVMVYANDNDGHLPGFRTSDSVMSDGVTKFNQYHVFSLYRDWHGHLVPYLLPELNNYFRRSGVYRDNQVYNYNGKIPTSNTMKEAWQLVKDSYELGGYSNLKTLICPQAFKTEDLHASTLYDGAYLPRISGLTNGGKIRNKGFSCVASTPTSYIANSVFFTDSYKNNRKDSRLSEIKHLDQKTLIVEGNQPIDVRYQGNLAYFEPSDYIGIDSVKNRIVDYDKRIFSFLHEGWKEFWVSSGFGGKYSGNMPEPLLPAFNDKFYPEAVMVHSRYSHWEKRIIVKGASVKGFFSRSDVRDFFTGFNYSFPASKADSHGKYLDVPYIVGEMNVLKGDGSVVKQNISTVHDKGLNAYYMSGD